MSVPPIAVSIDISGYVENVTQARARDIPFATAKALTRTVQDAQIEMRRDVQREFALRNSWTQDGIRITPADKLQWPITAEVYTDTGNDSAPDYLVLQEDGGDKQHHGSEFDFAIPTRYLRRYAPTTIPTPMRARNLLPVDVPIGLPVRGMLYAPMTGTRGRYWSRIGTRKMKQIGSSNYVAFKQYDRRGTLCIFVRIDGNREAEPWYVLSPRAHVRAALNMLPTVEAIAEDRFEQHWDDAWEAIGR